MAAENSRSDTVQAGRFLAVRAPDSFYNYQDLDRPAHSSFVHTVALRGLEMKTVKGARPCEHGLVINIPQMWTLSQTPTRLHLQEG